MTIQLKFSMTPISSLTVFAFYAGMTAILTSIALGNVQTVGVYDETATDEITGTAGTQNNAVDVSATSDSGTQVGLPAFKTAVQNAFANNLGGVVNFDNGTVTSGSITASYGISQAKALVISAGAPAIFGINSSTNRTGISHPGNNTTGNQLFLTSNGAGSEDFVFNFAAADKVVMAGATVLSRNSSPVVNVSIVAQATFSDATTASVTFTSSGSSNGGNDTFAGFKAPAGQFITQLKFDLDTSGSFRSLDDLAFVTDPAIVVPAVSFFDVAKAYADRMILDGRDTYGPQSSPLFASVRNRTTGALLTSLPTMANIRDFDRDPGGSNVFHDQQLLQLLYDLPRFTGLTSYSQAADLALTHFHNNLQSPATGLMAWGEHICWDLNTESPINRLDNPHGEDQHEFFETWQLAERSYDLAPTSMQRFAQGLWDHQIFDQTLGNFSRHAGYSFHDPESGMEFPRHGGYYILTWAESYARSSNPAERATRILSIDTLATSFLNRRHPTTGALPAGSGIDEYGKDYRNLHWLTNTIDMASSITRAAEMLPAAQAAKLNELATSVDDVFLSLPHLAGGTGFVADTLADNLSAITGRTSTWVSGYGLATDAGIALACLDRYGKTNRTSFRTLGLAAADRYLASQPPSNVEVHPGTFAEVIMLMLDAHQLTGNSAYRDRAEFFGTMAVSTFFDGTSGLPRASSLHGHYETITGGDDLGYVLLRLHEAISAPVQPSNLSVVPMPNGTATLTWLDQAYYEQGFKIERKQGNGAFIELANLVSQDSTTMTDSGLAPGAVYVYRMRAFNAEGFSPYSSEATVTAHTVIEDWRLLHFGTAANQGNAADSFDADFDGSTNLLEYGFGSSPVLAGPSPVIGNISSSHLSITFPRLSSRTDLTYRVRASDSFSTWVTIASSTGGAPFSTSGALSATESGSGEIKSVTVEDSVATGASPRRFLRVEIFR